MIDKKFVAVVLVMGLIVSIGCVIGQVISIRVDGYSLHQISSAAESNYSMAYISCYNKTYTHTQVGELIFLKDEMPPRYLANSAAVVLADEPPFLTIYYYYSRYDDIVNMLEGDGAKYLTFNPGQPETAEFGVIMPWRI